MTAKANNMSIKNDFTASMLHTNFYLVETESSLIIIKLGKAQNYNVLDKADAIIQDITEMQIQPNISDNVIRKSNRDIEAGKIEYDTSIQTTFLTNCQFSQFSAQSSKYHMHANIR